MSKLYAGIGSRETPKEINLLMFIIAKRLAEKGYTLRSGGAEGADLAFETGCGSGSKEIFLPWKGFNNSNSRLYTISNEAYEMAQKYHPNWGRLSPAAKKLMARNVYQALGSGLDKPVDFIVCWTKDGKASGGTGQALRIAADLGIKVYNLYWEDDREYFKQWLEI